MSHIITVTGLKSVGVPIGTPEFVNVFVRSKAHAACSLPRQCGARWAVH